MKKQGIIIIVIILILVVATFAFINRDKFAAPENQNTNNAQVSEEYKNLQTNDDYINAIDDTLNYIS